MSLAQVVREPLCNHEPAEPSHYETGIKSERKQQEFLKLRRTSRTIKRPIIKPTL